MREVLSFAALVVLLFVTLLWAAPRKHDCSLALITAISDAYEVLSQEGYDRQAEALSRATQAECKEPK